MFICHHTSSKVRNEVYNKYHVFLLILLIYLAIGLVLYLFLRFLERCLIYHCVFSTDGYTI
jgi:ABC-type arginine/histidine transport system permease subunit